MLLFNIAKVGVLMYSQILLIAAIIPVIVLGYFIYKRDVNKEPRSILAKLFILGFFSCIPIMICESILGIFFPTSHSNFLILFFNIFVRVGLVEEGFKWIITKKVGYNSNEFDEIYDIIVYSVFASLGFACVENILYVFGSGLFGATVRAITAIPGHTCFAVVMGYFFAKAKVSSINNNEKLYKKNIALSIIVPTLVHTAYDAFLMHDSSISTLSFYPFDIAMVAICFIIVDKVSKIQRNVNININKGAIVGDNNGHIHMNKELENNTKEVNFCPVCGNNVKGLNFCSSCGFKLK